MYLLGSWYSLNGNESHNAASYLGETSSSYNIKLNFKTLKSVVDLFGIPRLNIANRCRIWVS